MRKLLSIIIVITMLISSFIFEVSANSGEVSKKIVLAEDKPYENDPPIKRNYKKDAKNTTDLFRKLNSDLYRLVDDSLTKDLTAERQTREVLKQMDSLITPEQAKARGLSTTSEELVYVYIKLNEKSNLTAIEKHVNKIENIDNDNKLVAAWVATSKLKSLSAISEVISIEPILPPKTMSITSAGDQFHNADDFRAITGKSGAGIKIGVISNGVNNWTTARYLGELPYINVLSNTVGGDEGTAMLEIIHDLAPGAELYFHDCGTNRIAFLQAVQNLAAAGCQVIVDDIGWIEEPFFEDGIVAKQIDEFLNNPAYNYDFVYISAAGNAGRNHYQGLFKDDGYSYHDFDSTAGITRLPLYVPAGGYVQVIMQWNDQFGFSGNDYDLYLLKQDNAELDTSIRTQDGSQNPIEDVLYYNPSDTDYEIVYLDVEKYNGSAKTLELYVYGGAILDYGTSTDSIFGHAAVSDVIAVGAINALDSYGNPNASKTIANYSSQGDVTISYPTSQKRRKPDVCGIAGVEVTGVGGFSSPFYGTSAAAPHVAALAALLWSRDTSKNASEIRNLILTSTQDLGASGSDAIYGNGLVDLNEAMKVEIVALTASHTSPQPANTAITFTTNATGGTELLYRYRLHNGTAYTYLNAFTTENTYVWTPTKAGTYSIDVFVKDKNSTKSYDAVKKISYTVTEAVAQPVAISSLTANPASPQPANTAITLSTNATGGTELLYRYRLHNGTAYTYLNAFTTENTYVWTPTKAGTYSIDVFVKDSSSTKSYDAVKKISYTVTEAGAQPVAISSLTASPASPQPANTAITFTTNATGGTELLYRYRVFDGTVYTYLNAFTIDDTYVWTPTKAGTYSIYVFVKDSSSTASYDAVKKISYTVTEAGAQPVAISSLTTSQASPQPTNTPITLTTNATGGTELLYRYRVFDGTVYTYLNAFTIENTYVWTPTKAGTYSISVFVKDSSSTASYDAVEKISYTITEAVAQPVAINSLTASPASPQPADTAITLTTNATGGTELLYRYRVFDGTAYTYLNAFTTDDTYVWTPTKAGTYSISVFVKDSSSTASYDAVRKISYTITEAVAQPVAISSLTASPESPQPANTAITLTTNATGGTELLYRYRVFDGTTYTYLNAFTTDETYVWTPTKAGTYSISVFVKDSSSTASYDAVKKVVITIE